MAKKFLTSLDLNKNELQNAVIQVLASDPSTPSAGQVYYNSTTTAIRFYTGATWRTLGRLDQIDLPTASVSMNSQKITNLADPTVAQDAVTYAFLFARKITDFTTPTSALNMNSQKISSLADPTLAQDAATKNYVDTAVQGLKGKPSVRVASTANIPTLSGLLTVDGVTVIAGDRVLVKDNTTQTQNGIYVAGSGAWTRATDMDTSLEFSAAFVFVEEGTANADTGWLCTNNGSVTVGTTNITFTQFSAAGQITASNVGTLGTGVFKQKTGANLEFRNIAGGNGVDVTLDGNNNIVLDVNQSELQASGFAKVYNFVSTGTTGNITVTHNLGEQYPTIAILDTVSGFSIEADITYTSANAFTATIPGTYAVGQYRFTVVG
jgi:hypothetical protein